MSKKKENQDPKQKKDPFRHSLVVENLVHVKTGRSFWGKEVKTLKTLMKDYPDKEFWMSLRFYPKLFSLVQLLAEPLKSDLKLRYNLKKIKFDNFQKEPIEISKRKYGKSPVLDKKPKTLRQFLSNGATKKTRSSSRAERI